tara:strand:+ start:154 stop:318 length:165 start_codon:yes stop_codon:yes gene_type:complete
MSKIFTTNSLKGNPWMETNIDKDRRMHNLKKGKKTKLKKGMKSRAQKSIKLNKF